MFSSGIFSNSFFRFLVILAALLTLIFIFLALREFNTWYWKIDERIKLMKNIDDKLDKILSSLNDKTEK